MEMQKLESMRVKNLNKIITKCLVTQGPGESALLPTCTIRDNVCTQQWYAFKIKEVDSFSVVFVKPSLKLAYVITNF